MINLIGILIMLGAEAFIIYILFTWQKENYESAISKRDKTVWEMQEKIKIKNLKIKELEQNDRTRKSNK